MRVPAGAEAVTEREGAEDRSMMEMSIMEPRGGQSGCGESAALEQNQGNQQRYHLYPCDRISGDDAVPEPAIGKHVFVWHQRAAIQTFDHHGTSPEMFRQVDGSRIAAVSVFLSNPRDSHASACTVRVTSLRRAGFRRLVAFKTAQSDHLLPSRDAASVQLNSEN
jgi:hypothetical protein